MKKIKSCIKWTGGKYRELDSISKHIPHSFNTYVEPFVGGGALFWSLKNKYPNKEYHINDINADLIGFYNVVQRDFYSLLGELSTHTSIARSILIVLDIYTITTRTYLK